MQIIAIGNRSFVTGFQLAGVLSQEVDTANEAWKNWREKTALERSNILRKWNDLILENQEVILPPTITKVPALLLLDRGYEVLFGNQILQHLQPIH